MDVPDRLDKAYDVGATRSPNRVGKVNGRAPIIEGFISEPYSKYLLNECISLYSVLKPKKGYWMDVN